MLHNAYVKTLHRMRLPRPAPGCSVTGRLTPERRCLTSVCGCPPVDSRRAASLMAWSAIFNLFGHGNDLAGGFPVNGLANLFFHGLFGVVHAFELGKVHLTGHDNKHGLFKLGALVS